MAYNSRKLSLSTHVRITGCFGHGVCANFIRTYVYHGLQMVITKPPAASHSVLLIGLVLHTPPLKSHTNTERMHRRIQGSRYVALCRHMHTHKLGTESASSPCAPVPRMAVGKVRVINVCSQHSLQLSAALRGGIQWECLLFPYTTCCRQS